MKTLTITPPEHASTTPPPHNQNTDTEYSVQRVMEKLLDDETTKYPQRTYYQ